MIKQFKPLILVLVLLLNMLIPTSITFASERMFISHSEATSAGGGSYNVYGTFSAFSNNAAVFNAKIPKDGYYIVTANLGSDREIVMNASTDKVQGEAVTVNTGGTAMYRDYEMTTLFLTEGTHKISVRITTSGIATITGIYLDEAMGMGTADFTKKTGAFKKHILPTDIEAEDFDFNSAVSGVGGGIINSKHRKDSAVNIVDELSCRVINAQAGDKMEYTFEVKNTGYYDISIASTSSGKARLYFDGSEGYVEGSLYQREKGSFGTAYFKKGTHKVKLEVLTKGTNVDKICFKSSKKKNDYYNPSDLVAGKSIVIEKEETEEKANPIWKNIYVDANAKTKGSGTKGAPYKTIEEAKDAVAKLSKSMKGDIVVNIAEGTYYIEEKIQFGINDGGKNGYNVIYRGVSEGDKPVVSGGKKIDGWQKMDNGIWYAKVDDSINVIRQMYVNDLPARMARSKYQYRGTDAYDNPATEYKNDGYYIPKKNFPLVSNTEDMELLYIYDWAMSYFPINKISDAGDYWIVEYDQPFFERYYNGTYDHGRPGASVKMYLLNAPELIDEYGEFYFDKKTKMVYYYAYPQEDMTTAEVYTPYSEGLIEVSGDGVASRVQNIVFDNLDFRHGAWNDIARTGMLNGQGDSMIPPDVPNDKINPTWQTGWFPSIFEVNFADGISVENCNFIDNGATALAFRDFVTNSKIIGNYFHDISASAILVGDVYTGADNRTVESISRNITVANNMIRRIGLDYAGGIGIQILYANSVDVLNNDIKYTSYSGITAGWGWGAGISNTLRSGQHLISRNKTAHTGLTVYDGASMYTLSEMKGTFIEENVFSHSKDSGGIYYDQGSRSIVSRNNVLDSNKINTFFYNSDGADMYLNYANYVDRLSGRTLPATKTIMTEAPIRVEGDNWGPEARTIMANAGLSEEYKYLLDSKNAELPSWKDNPLDLYSKKIFESKTDFIKTAGDFNEGGEGVAYHDTSAKGPTVYGVGGGIGDTVQGEWLEYTLKPQVAGTYDMFMHYSLAFTGAEANASNFSSVTIYIDGKPICSDLPLESTGAWQSEKKLPLASVELTEGEHQMRLEFTKGSFAVSKFQFENPFTKATDESFDDGIFFKINN